MHNNPKDINTIIRLVLSGDADEADIKVFQHWLNASEDNRLSFEVLQKVWENEWNETKLSHTDTLAAQIWNKATQHENKLGETRRLIPWGNLLKIAAAVIIVFLAALAYQELQQPQQQVIEPIALTIEKKNPPGQKSKIILPDSTVVWLNAASSLTYEKPFNDSIRLVNLKGEAYFEVSENPKWPFVVQSGKLSTTALGTSFNICNYEDQAELKVALLTGKVKVEANTHQKKMLLPGEGLVYHKSDESYGNFKVDLESILAWKNGVLIFENDGYEDFKFKLEKWYGVSINTSGEIPNHWSLEGRYDGVYLDDLLDNIKYNKGFTYQLEGKRLMIKF